MPFKLNPTGGGGKQGVVPAALDVFTWQKEAAALADNNIARSGVLPGKQFDAEALALGIPAEVSRAAGFSMGHEVRKGEECFGLELYPDSFRLSRPGGILTGGLAD
jgi:hypothetical protein